MQTSMTLDETALILSARQGDLEAFAKLVALHQKSVRACVAARTDSPHDADDIAQEVFLIAHRKLGELNAEQSLGPWLRSVAFYLLKNHQRKTRRSPLHASEEIAAMADQALIEENDPGQDEERLAAMRHCLDQLEPPARELVRLRYEENLPLQDIGARLNRKHSALTMALHRLRQELRDCMEQQLKEATA